jgi:hypothetical protein
MDEALILRKDMAYLDLLRKKVMEDTWGSKARLISNMLGVHKR